MNAKERLTSNQQVEGSSPSGIAIYARNIQSSDMSLRLARKRDGRALR